MTEDGVFVDIGQPQTWTGVQRAGYAAGLRCVYSMITSVTFLIENAVLVEIGPPQTWTGV